MWALSPAERLFLRLGLTPDFFNFAGLFCGLATGILIGLGRLEWGGLAIALGGVADIFDGRIARARKLASPYGTFIDSTLDRFVEVFAFLGFVFYLRATPFGPLIATAALAGSLLVSYTRARGESLGVTCKEGLMQRAERLVLTFLACMVDAPVSAAAGLGARDAGPVGARAHRRRHLHHRRPSHHLDLRPAERETLEREARRSR